MSDDATMLGRILAETSATRREVEATGRQLTAYEERLRLLEVHGAQPCIELRDEVRANRVSRRAADKSHADRLEALERHDAEQKGRSAGMTAGLTLAAGGAGATVAKLIAWLSGSGGGGH